MCKNMKRPKTKPKGHPWKQLEPSFQSWIDLVRGDVASNALELRVAIEEFRPKVWRSGWVILREMGFRNLEGDADAAVNGWFVRLYEGGLDRYDRAQLFFPYGYDLFLKACYDLGRKEKKHMAASLAVDVGDRRQLINRDREELREEVRRVINRMANEDHRQALTLMCVDGLEPMAAADRLKIKRSTFNGRTFSGRKIFEADFTNRNGWRKRNP